MLVAVDCQQDCSRVDMKRKIACAREFGGLTRSEGHILENDSTVGVKKGVPCRKMSSPTDDMMDAPLSVEMPLSVSSSLGYIALTEVERCKSGALSALPFSIAMVI